MTLFQRIFGHFYRIRRYSYAQARQTRSVRVHEFTRVNHYTAIGARRRPAPRGLWPRR